MPLHLQVISKAPVTPPCLIEYSFWSSSNLLKAKTPKECVAGYEKIISIIKAQIEANNTEQEEIKAQLPSSKEKKEIYKKTVEEFSIKRLSEFLSDEELEIIKK